MELRTITKELLKNRAFRELARPLDPLPPLIVQELAPIVESNVILEPVSEVKSTTRPAHIEPIDLAKISVKINSGVYLTPQDWVDDINLIVKVP